MITVIIDDRIRTRVPDEEVISLVKSMEATKVQLSSNSLIDMSNMEELYDYGLSFGQNTSVLDCDIYKLASFGGIQHFFSRCPLEGYVADEKYHKLYSVNVYIPGLSSPIKGAYCHIIQTAPLKKIYQLRVYGDFSLNCWHDGLLNVDFEGHDVLKAISLGRPKVRFEQPLHNNYSYFIIVPETLQYI
jgi:hypothetical protein